MSTENDWEANLRWYQINVWEEQLRVQRSNLHHATEWLAQSEAMVKDHSQSVAGATEKIAFIEGQLAKLAATFVIPAPEAPPDDYIPIPPPEESYAILPPAPNAGTALRCICAEEPTKGEIAAGYCSICGGVVC